MIESISAVTLATPDMSCAIHFYRGLRVIFDRASGFLPAVDFRFTPSATEVWSAAT
jgi:hypothetical protein